MTTLGNILENTGTSVKRIGLFDSGLGGLTVLEPLIRAFPIEFIYVADTKHLPYGNRSAQELEAIAHANVRYLLTHDVDMIIIACHTLSAIATKSLKKKFPTVPIIGIIELVGLVAAQTTKTNHIGLLATQATINSKAYDLFFQKDFPSITLTSVACPDLVPLIEEVPLNRTKIKNALNNYAPLFANKPIDVMILGSTHYSLIEPQIAQAFPSIHHFVSGQSVFRDIIEQSDIKNNELGTLSLFVTGDAQEFATKFFSVGTLPMPRVIQNAKISL